MSAGPRLRPRITGDCEEHNRLLRKFREHMSLVQRYVREFNNRLENHQDKKFQPVPPQLLEALRAASEARAAVRDHEASHGCVGNSTADDGNNCFSSIKV